MSVFNGRIMMRGTIQKPKHLFRFDCAVQSADLNGLSENIGNAQLYIHVTTTLPKFYMLGRLTCVCD